MSPGVRDVYEKVYPLVSRNLSQYQERYKNGTWKPDEDVQRIYDICSNQFETEYENIVYGRDVSKSLSEFKSAAQAMAKPTEIGRMHAKCGQLMALAAINYIPY